MLARIKNITKTYIFLNVVLNMFVLITKYFSSYSARSAETKAEEVAVYRRSFQKWDLVYFFVVSYFLLAHSQDNKRKVLSFEICLE